MRRIFWIYKNGQLESTEKDHAGIVMALLGIAFFRAVGIRS